MKRARVLLLIFLPMIVGVVCWQFVFKREVIYKPKFASNQDSGTMPVPPVTNRVIQSPPVHSAAWFAAREREREELIRSGLDEWRTPIEFYGKVVDQYGDPVEGARVDFSCNDDSDEGTTNYSRASNNDGIFSIAGIRGKLLVVKVSKPGYYTSRRNPSSFYYAGGNENFLPDAANPVRYLLYKKGQVETVDAKDFPGLTRIEQLRSSGVPKGIDLLEGRAVPIQNAHLILEFWRENTNRSARVYDWRCRFTIPDGGLVETAEEFAFEAPEKGYIEAIEVKMSSEDENWESAIRRKYYIRLPGELYGSVEIYLSGRNGVFKVRSVINPSGSRNVEYEFESAGGTWF
jgi:hypothetical protein